MITRRTLLSSAAGLTLLPLLPQAARAQSTSQARGLVDRVVADINGVIASGQSESAMIREFERIFARYADLPTIAQSVLGPTARSVSQSQLRSFTEAFQGYIARKYGRRFREFIGGTVTVTGAQDVGRFVEVMSRIDLRGSSPFEVRFRVWDRSGSPRFIDMLIEGISLVITERQEIASMLGQRGNNIDTLTADLRRI